MSPLAAREAMLQRRLLRLQRLVAYRQDGHGNELNDTALEMVERCIQSTVCELREIKL